MSTMKERLKYYRSKWQDYQEALSDREISWEDLRVLEREAFRCKYLRVIRIRKYFSLPKEERAFKRKEKQLKIKKRLEKEIAVVYCLRNTSTNGLYIGASENRSRREREHKKLCENKKHHNHRVEQSLLLGQTFSFEILEIVKDRSQLEILERKWISQLCETEEVYNCNFVKDGEVRILNTKKHEIKFGNTKTSGLGKEIRKLRVQKQLTQGDVALLVGVNSRTIGRVERGVGNTSEGMALNILSVLKKVGKMSS